MDIKPNWKHDCTECKFLGLTIGGGRLVDLYVHENDNHNLTTLVARYGDDGPEYYSMHPNLIRSAGHSELFVAKALYEESLNVPDVTPSSGCVFCDIGLKPVDGYHKTVTEDVKCPLNSPH